MNFEIIILSGLIIVLIIILYFKKSSVKYTNVKMGDIELRVEIADTFIKRTKGLMFRKSLNENEGILFIFNDEDYHGIWMMNMSFPIDIIWVDRDKKIVDITKDVQPCRLNCPVYKPREKSLYVLEVKANFTEKDGIRIGSTLEFEL